MVDILNLWITIDCDNLDRRYRHNGLESRTEDHLHTYSTLGGKVFGVYAGSDKHKCSVTVWIAQGKRSKKD